MEPHPVFTVEVKYRKKISQFLKDGLAQAKRYDDTKVPILALYERNMKGGLILMHTSDFEDLLGKL